MPRPRALADPSTARRGIVEYIGRYNGTRRTAATGSPTRSPDRASRAPAEVITTQDGPALVEIGARSTAR